MQTSAGPDDQEQMPRRLGSWKEIAAYFEKDVRTVRRWELERGLPVHRVRGGERGSVFAYAVELERWLREREVGPSDPLAIAVPDAAPPRADEPAKAKALEGDVGGWNRRRGARGSRSWTVALFGTAVALLVAVGVLRHAVARPVGASGNQAAAPGSGHTTDTETLDLYLRGRYLWNLRTEGSLTQAVDVFTQAIVRDPKYAPAYAGLADSYLLLREYGHMTDAEAYPRAYFASRRALALDDLAAEAHRSYAFVLDHWMWNFPAAELEYQRAIALDPKDAQSYQWYATGLLSAGRASDALREIDIARQLDPGSVPILIARGLILGSVDLPAGIAALSQVEEMNPGLVSLHTYLAGLYFEAERYPEFVTEARQSAVLHGAAEEVNLLDAAKQALERGGRREMLLRLAQGYGALADEPRNGHAPQAAQYYACLQDREHTLQYLALSRDRRESNLQPVRYMKEYEFLRGNPQFEALLQHMRSPYEQAQADEQAVLRR